MVRGVLGKFIHETFYTDSIFFKKNILNGKFILVNLVGYVTKADKSIPKEIITDLHSLPNQSKPNLA